MIQYEIRWANLPAPIGRRRVLLLTRAAGYDYLNKVIVAEVTATIRGIPQEVLLGAREGLPRPSVVNLDNVHVVPKALLGERIGRLSSNRHREVKRARLCPRLGRTEGSVTTHPAEPGRGGGLDGFWMLLTCVNRR